MFTGLVQQKGELSALEKIGNGYRLKILTSPWENDPLVLGESVAVQGVCLTITSILPNGFTADLLNETLSRTALGTLKRGASLNLERALRLGDRLGGHIVSGHVDETGILQSITPDGRDFRFTISVSSAFSRASVLKGSVAIDGISLTITALTATSLTVNIIPHTLSHTSLCERKIGDKINLESDILGKYVLRALGKDATGNITLTLLEKAGFV